MGGSLRAVNVSLSQLMLAALKVPQAQIVGAPLSVDFRATKHMNYFWVACDTA